jgi:hypothetical protein
MGRPSNLCVLFLALLCPTCVPAYRPPTASEPHAVVKLRRSYEQHAGTELDERIQINGFELLRNTRPSGVHSALIDAVLAHPGATTWRFQSTFYHQETRFVNEPYQYSVPYTSMRTFPCGSPRAPSVCTQPITDYRYFTQYRYVPRLVNVPDASCRATLSHVVDVGHVYLVELTYQDDETCQLRCYEQTPQGNHHCRPAGSPRE